jgi:acetyltransferase-like isoleucine patch superfamily enzyme
MASVRSRIRRLLTKSTGSGLPPAQRLDQRDDLRQFDIGRYSWGHLTVSNRTPGAALKVGQFCSFAYGVHILLGGEHRMDFVSTYRFPAYTEFAERAGHLAGATSTTHGGVTIGNDVWVGNEALILSGVTIGDGAVIGAGSVVRQDVPPYAIVAGNPGRVAGFRFPKEQIDALLAISWWDWPIEKIVDSLELMMSEDIQRFIDTYG